MENNVNVALLLGCFALIIMDCLLMWKVKLISIKLYEIENRLAEVTKEVTDTGSILIENTKKRYYGDRNKWQKWKGNKNTYHNKEYNGKDYVKNFKQKSCKNLEKEICSDVE